jgi:hypothetical protein
MMPNDPPVAPRRSSNTPVLWIVLGVIAVCGCGGVAVLAAILFPVFSQARFAAKKTATLSNAKTASLGLIMYASDWNDRLPLPETWMDATMPYTKNDSVYKSILASEKDPSKYGFAFREALAGKKASAYPDPENWAMIFDSTLTHRNATSNLETLPKPGRYLGANIVAFLDGHAQAMRDAALQNLDSNGNPQRGTSSTVDGSN